MSTATKSNTTKKQDKQDKPIQKVFEKEKLGNWDKDVSKILHKQR